MKRLMSTVLAVGLLASAAAVSAKESLQVSDAWIREAPANAKALGAFATIHNPSDTAYVLVGARSSAAEKLELHKTIMEGEVAKMVPQGEIQVPAKSEVKLQPGGLHIMMIGPKQPLKAGDKVEITLEFKGGMTMPVTFEVRKAGNMNMKMDMGGMDHGSMHH